MDFYNQINSERRRMEEIAATLAKNLKHAPPGKISSNKRNNGVEYYWLDSGTPSKNRKGIYIHKDNVDLIRSLVQKEYDQKALKAAQQFLKIYDRLQHTYTNYSIEKIYDSLAEHKKQFINPVVLPEAEYTKQWIDKPYLHRTDFDDPQKYVTARGESVRSKSEIILANCFDTYNIPYKYECPLFLGPNLVLYPDFTLLNRRTRKEWYWEHCGMMGDESYADSCIAKMNQYTMHGYYLGKNMIYTYESQSTPLNYLCCEQLIKEFLL